MDYQDLINAEYDAAEAIRASAKADKRVLSDDEMTKIEAHLDSAKSLNAKKERAEKLDSELAASKAAVPSKTIVPNSTPSANIQVRDVLEGDKSAGFKTKGDFLMSVMGVPMGVPANEAKDKRLRFLAVSGNDENHTLADQYGGFTVPEAFDNRLLQITPEGDPTIGRVTNIPMASPTVKMPTRVDKDHASSVSGGIIVSRKEETQAGQTSRMKFGQVKLEATTVFGSAFVSSELLNDSAISFAAVIAQGFDQAFADFEFEEKLKGVGAGGFEGVFNSKALVETTRSNAGDIDIDDVLNIRSRMWGYSNAIWLANHSTVTKLAKLQQGTGASFSLVYMPSSQEDRPDMLLGRPIFYTEYMNNLGDRGDLGCFDWSQYLVGTLQGKQQAESMHVRFLSNENCIKFWMRNDGRSWWNSALTPKNGAPTRSPFNILQA